MFERFAERARGVVVRAHEEAHVLKQDLIGSEHILLDLGVKENDRTGARG